MRAISRALGASIFALTASYANAAELTVSAYVPSTHLFVTKILQPWTAQMEEASGGSLKFRFLPQPVAGAAAHYDAVRDGLVDLTMLSLAYYPTQFELLRVGKFPMIANTAESRGVAIERTYEKFFADKMSEYKGLKVLGHWTNGPGVSFTTTRAMSKIEDFAGSKIRIAGPVAIAVGESLGTSVIVKSAPEAYELMAGGIVDGIFFPKQGPCAFKMDSLINHATVVPGGFYGDVNVMVMNEDAYNKLTEDERAAIDKFAGDYVSALAGQANDAEDQQCWDSMRANGLEVVEADETFVSQLNDKSKPLLDQWVAKVKEVGLNPDEVMAYLNEQVADVEKAEAAGK